MTSTPLGGIPGFTATGPLSGPSDAGPSSSPGADTPGGGPFDQFSVPMPAPAPRPSSGRPHRGPVRVAIGRDAAGNEFSTTDFGQPAMPAQRSPAGAPLRFKSPTGRPLTARTADATSLVVDATGNVVSDLGSLIAAGLIRETESGGYEMVGQHDAGPAGEPEDASQQDTGEPQAAQPERFDDPQLEHFVSQLQEGQSGLYNKMVELIADQGMGGTLPAHVVETAAAEFGVTTEQARDTINTVAQAFRMQMSRYVSDSGIDPQNMEHWLASENLDPQVKELFRKAQKAHARDRTLDGYDHVIARFLETLARDYPEALMKQLEGHANIRKDPTTGAILVDIPNLGETTFEVAARQGWLKTRRDARGRFTSS